MPALAHMPDDDARELALCAVDNLADQIHSECFGAEAFAAGPFSRFNQIDNAVCLIKTDYLNADAFSTPELLALALGLTANDQVRIAAMDALAKRCGVQGAGMSAIHATPIAERAYVTPADGTIFINYPESKVSGAFTRMRDAGMGPFWWITESRTDSDGSVWVRQIRKAVIDDFGALVEVKP